jgi:hypothetical protein
MSSYTEEQLYGMDDDEFDKVYKDSLGSDDAQNDPVADEVVEDLEQPESEDSDDNTSSDSEDETETEEESEEEESESEETTEESDEDEPAKEEVKSGTEEQPQVSRRKYKANGREYEFTDQEIIEKFGTVFGQAMDYTKKTQAIKQYRKKIDALETAGIDDNTLSLLIDVAKGDKDAIAEVLKRTKVDTLELDVEGSKYTPKDYGRNAEVLDIEEVVKTISADPEYAVTQRVLSKEWDEKSWSEMTKNPKMIEGLHVDVKNGIYDKVQPIAEKLKVYGGGRKSDLEYYLEAGEIYYTQLRQEQARTEQATVKGAEKAKLEEVRAKQTKVAEVKNASEKRKAAAPTKKAVGVKKPTDYLNDSDEAFEDWYKKLKDSE